MKTRIILFLLVCAVLTLSFTFVSINKSKKSAVKENTTDISSEPVGGFIAEDKI